jgi:hypothetical protein
MIPELILRLLTREVSHRGLGFTADGVALWSRATRRRRDWAPHEARCHAVVREAMADLPCRRTVVVLGSGLCRDVPLDALAAAFARVVLVDAVHLPPLLRRLRRYPNVSCLTRDLTGCADWVLRTGRERVDPVGDLVADPTVDLVISANVLSQLPLPLERRIEGGRAPHVPPDLPDQVVRWHLEDLSRFTARVCLLTDIECRDVAVSPGAPVLARLDLLRGAVLPEPDATWDWTVAPPGEVDRGIALVHRVHAYRDLAAARGRPTPPR